MKKKTKDALFVMAINVHYMVYCAEEKEAGRIPLEKEKWLLQVNQQATITIR